MWQRVPWEQELLCSSLGPPQTGQNANTKKKLFSLKFMTSDSEFLICIQ